MALKSRLLIETENEHVKVKMERDPSGQVIKEWQNDHWIQGQYEDIEIGLNYNRFRYYSPVDGIYL
ncbi:hypothetical protein [Bacillus sp. RS11]|uniref:hypothetical protein n=1 Tax=Lysinibacillus sp. RS11 TaxID=3242682 RepID=UPI0035C6EDC2